MQGLGILFQVLAKFISQTFPKYQFQSALQIRSNEQLLSNSALCLTFYQQNIGRNVMLRNFAPSTDEVYQ